jgi:hypothetical protein
VKSKTVPFIVPTLSDASPDYATKLKRRDDMQAALSSAERESTELRARLNATGVTSNDGAKALRVAALLDEPSGSAELTVGLDRARLAEVDRNIGDRKAALTLMTQRVRTARAAASAKICSQVASEHRLRVSAICGKLVQLHAAVAAYVTLADEMNANDIVWQGIIPSHPIFFGEPNDKNSPIASYLRLAVAEGNFPANEVPVALS